jgi:DNA-binding NtrC family response regulator
VILLAEDDAAVRLATTRILEKNGYTVLVAVNGSEALEIHEANSSKIDLLITDIIMPEMSGRDLVAQSHERDPQMAVLVMSGYTEHTSRNRELVDAGMAFIQKPFTPDQLLASVQHALNSAGVHAHS